MNRLSFLLMAGVFFPSSIQAITPMDDSTLSHTTFQSEMAVSSPYRIYGSIDAAPWGDDRAGTGIESVLVQAGASSEGPPGGAVVRPGLKSFHAGMGSHSMIQGTFIGMAPGESLAAELDTGIDPVAVKKQFDESPASQGISSFGAVKQLQPCP